MQPYNKFMEISHASLWNFKQRRLQFAGHCFHAKNEVVSSLLLWHPSGPVGLCKLTFPDTTVRDLALHIQDLETTMLDHEVWKEIVMSVPTTYRLQDDDNCDWFIWETASHHKMKNVCGVFRVVQEFSRAPLQV